MAEVHQFACINYIAEQRYKDWEQRFEVELKKNFEKAGIVGKLQLELDQTTSPAAVTVTDATQVELASIRTEIQTLEEITHKQDTPLTTDIYSTVNETIVKLCIRLDRTIDVNDVSKYREERRGLHSRINNIENQLTEPLIMETPPPSSLTVVPSSSSNVAKIEEYIQQMQSFLETRLYFPPENLQKEHSRLKGLIFPSLLNLENVANGLMKETESEIDELFSHFKQDNLENCNRCNQLQKIGATHCFTKCTEIQNTLFVDMTARPLDFFYQYSNQRCFKHFEQFTSKLPTKWKSHMNEWYRLEIDKFLAIIYNLTSIIRQYTIDMRTFFQKNVCVESQQFDETQTIYLVKAKAQMAEKIRDCELTETENRLNWQSKMHKTIETIGELFRKDNLEALKQEKEILARAFSHAEKTYNQTMAWKISESKHQLAKTEIQEFHELCKAAVVSSFAEIPLFTYSHLWQLAQDRLGEHLNKLFRRNNHIIVNKPQHFEESNVRVNSVDNFAVTVPTPNKSVQDPRCTELMTTVNNFDETTGRTVKVDERPRPLVSAKVDINSRDNFAVTVPTLKSGYAEQIAYKGVNGISGSTIIADEKPYVVGIFIGSDKVHVGIYKSRSETPIYLKFSPFIAFTNTVTLYFEAAKSSSPNFNIFDILKAAQNVPSSVLIYNQQLNLRTEEIAGLFLHQIRSNAGRVAKQDLKSCVATVSALWSTSSKQMLKYSLFLAGFERRQLIQSTTSIGLSYLLKPYSQVNGYVALVHQNSSGFDVAIADVSSTAVRINKIFSNASLLETASGWYEQIRGIKNYFSKTEDTFAKLVKIVKSILDDLGIKEERLMHFILTTALDVTPKQKSLLKDSFEASELTVLNEQKGIVLGAAALNAQYNGNVDVETLEFEEVFPHDLICKINDKASSKMICCNNPLVSTDHYESTADGKTSNTLSIYELSGVKENLIGTYSVKMYRSSMGRQTFKVTLTAESLVEVELQSSQYESPAVLHVQTNFMTPLQLVDASANMFSILRRVNREQN